MLRIAVPALLMFAASPAFADVIDAGPSGFTVTVTTLVTGTPTQAYRALTEGIGAWWDKDHTFSGNATNLSIDPRPGGCFCERLPNGGGVRHMTVVYADPGKLVRLSGGLGPLQAMAVTGTMTWTFTEGEAATTIAVTYRVSGYMPGPGGVGATAKPVDAVLTAQVIRLKQFVESAR